MHEREMALYRYPLHLEYIHLAALQGLFDKTPREDRHPLIAQHSLFDRLDTVAFPLGLHSQRMSLQKTLKQFSRIAALFAQNKGELRQGEQPQRRLLPVQQGELDLDGRLVQAYAPKDFARKVAVLPQVRQVPQIPVMALVEHGRFPYGGFVRRRTQQDARIVQDAMRRMDIHALWHANTTPFSGGERQKAYLVMQLAQNTQTMLLEEPTTFLDVRHQLELLRCIRQLAHEEGKAVGLVLHDLCQALARRYPLCVLDGGRIAYLGAPEQLLQASLLQKVFSVQAQRLQEAKGEGYYVCCACP